MNHFDQILGDGESVHRHPYQDNEELYDKSTNQSNFLTASIEPMNSPFDTSPKASMFFFNLNSPRQNCNNFQFNTHFEVVRENSRHNIQPISRRLQFQEDQSLFVEEEEVEQEQNTIKQEDPYSYSEQEIPQKTKKIKKNCKGLKSLSVGVYEIVTDKGQTTYKEVANTLIQKLKKKSKEQDAEQKGYDVLKNVEKDQHNIKRRVYDALNVLISAGLLRKQGKKVIFNSKIKRQANKTSGEESTQISTNLEHLQNSLQEKKKQLESLKLRYLRISNLINRNKKLGLKYTKIIKLPFVIAKSKMENIRSISIDGSGDVEIDFDGNVFIMGDIDTIDQIQKPTAFILSKFQNHK